jgi:hypothetical protein
MIVAARKLSDRGHTEVSFAQRPLLQSVSQSLVTDAPAFGMVLTPVQAAVMKAALIAQRAALEGAEEDTPALTTTFTQATVVDLPDLPEVMDARPLRSSSKKKGVTLRSTGTERVSDDAAKARRQAKAEAKAAKREAFKQNPDKSLPQASSPRKHKPVVPVVGATEVEDSVSLAFPPRPDDETFEVCWTHRVNRKTTKIVRVKRTKAYEQWFEDNPPEGLKFTMIQPRVEGRYECRTFTQSASARIGNLDVNLGYEVTKHVTVPVGISEKQREEGLLKRYHTKVSRQKRPAAVRVRILSLMTASLYNSKSKTEGVNQLPWAEASQAANDPQGSVDSVVTEDVGEHEVVDYDDPGRIARIRHRAYIQRYVMPQRLARHYGKYNIMPPFEVSKALKPIHAGLKSESYDAFESGDYTARVMTKLLRNEADAKLRDLQAGKPQTLWRVSEHEGVPVHTKLSALADACEADMGEQIERLEAFKKSTASDVPLTDEQISQAVFDAIHYRPDMRTKKQVARDELNAQKSWEDAQTKEWVSLEQKERRKLFEQQLIGCFNVMERRKAYESEAWQNAQEQARLDNWLQDHSVSNYRDAELYDQWLMKRAKGNLFAGRLMHSADDKNYQMWLFDNCSDEYRLQSWLYDNNTPRADNIIDMMEWRHRQKREKEGADHEASAKTGDSILPKLTLPVKSHEICVYDSLMADHALTSDKKRDVEITSFGKVVRDINKVVSKFNKSEKSGLYLPGYWGDTT